MRAFVLAAGMGTRLGSLTRDTPKVLMPIGGRPLLLITLEALRRAGVEEVAVNLHYQAEAIERCLRDHPIPGLRVVTLHERELQGTAGALLAVAERWAAQPMLVVYGDVLNDVHYPRLWSAHAQTGADVTMLVRRTDQPSAVGILSFDESGRVQRFLEKPQSHQVFSHWCSAGIMVLAPDVLRDIPAGVPSDIGRDLLPGLLAQGRPVQALPLLDDEYLVDIGTPDAYAGACEAWPLRGQGTHPGPS